MSKPAEEDVETKPHGSGKLEFGTGRYEDTKDRVLLPDEWWSYDCMGLDASPDFASSQPVGSTDAVLNALASV